MSRLVKNKNIIFSNVLASLILNTVSIISGFIIPKIIISSLGSEVNGLYLSLDQYLNFFSLLEGGLGGVIMASLYKPILEKDTMKISSIIVTATKFFRKIALLFIMYMTGVSLLYPVIFKTSFDYGFIASLSFILGINFFVRYYFLLIYRMLLQADRKVYVTALVQSVLVVLEIILFIIFIRMFPSIHVIKLISTFVYILQFLILSRYVKTHYTLDKNAPEDKKLIAQRWDGMGIMIAAFIHQNTDIIILTSFTSLLTVSVYTVYNMVVNALRSVVASIVSGITPSIGRIIAGENKEDILNIYTSYEFLLTYVSFILFTCCALLIVPFVMIYTKGVTDTNYNQLLFSLILTIAQLQYCLREASTTILYAANRYRDIRWYAYIEAILNITISVLLVVKFGLIGVAVGTAASILIRHIFHIHYLEKNLVERGYGYPIKLYGLFYSMFVLLYYILIKFTVNISINYLTWIYTGIIIFAICFISYTLLSILFFRKEFKECVRLVKERK